jgi:putative transposase
MKFDPKIHKRRSIRLPGYDYTRTGMYFITMVTHERDDLFGTIMEREVRLNQYGQTARE